MKPRVRGCKETRREQSLFEDAVAAVLDNTATNSRINFTVGNMRITTWHLALVGVSVRAGEVRVTLGDRGQEFGTYNGKANFITLPSRDLVMSPIGRAAIIHEGVHAVNDYMGRTTNTLDEEAA